MFDLKKILILTIGIIILISCGELKEKTKITVRDEHMVDTQIYHDMWQCFDKMLKVDSLQPYFTLCLHAYDSCKPYLFITENYWAEVLYKKGKNDFTLEEQIFAIYENDFKLKVERLYTRQGIDLWVDYFLYFTNIEPGRDSFYIGFDMKVESNYKAGPTASGLHAYRPRRNYPQIHADVYFHRVDTSWEVSNYVIHPLPPHQPRDYLNDGVGGFRKEPPRFDCYADPAEEIPYPGQADSVWQLPPLPPVRGSSTRDH